MFAWYSPTAHQQLLASRLTVMPGQHGERVEYNQRRWIRYVDLDGQKQPITGLSKDPDATFEPDATFLGEFDDHLIKYIFADKIEIQEGGG